MSSGNILSNGECCRIFLDALERKVLPALRTEREKSRESDSKIKYNSARLLQDLVAHGFDALGNFNCHSTCLSSRLGLSSTLVARAHRTAIERAEAPTKKVSIREIFHRGFEDRALLPSGNTSSRNSFFKSALFGTPYLLLDVNIIGLSAHGLAGKRSNRGRVYELDQFKLFI